MMSCHLDYDIELSESDLGLMGGYCFYGAKNFNILSYTKQTKRVLFSISLCAIFFIVMYFFGPSLEKGRCYDYNIFKDKEIDGIVVNKFRNPNEHSYPTLMIKNFNSDSLQSLILSSDTTDTYNALNISDTILKRKGEDQLFLKQNGIYKFLNRIDFGCDHK
jgi:hypothetical protein